MGAPPFAASSSGASPGVSCPGCCGGRGGSDGDDGGPDYRNAGAGDKGLDGGRRLPIELAQQDAHGSVLVRRGDDPLRIGGRFEGVAVAKSPALLWAIRFVSDTVPSGLHETVDRHPVLWLFTPAHQTSHGSPS